MLENIDCANCSAKIEAKIRELPEVDDAVLTFATRQLRVYSSAGAALLPKMQEIADKIEPGTVISIREESRDTTKAPAPDKHRRDIPELVSGGALFIIGELLAGSMPKLSSVFFIAAYLILGRNIHGSGTFADSIGDTANRINDVRHAVIKPLRTGGKILQDSVEFFHIRYILVHCFHKLVIISQDIFIDIFQYL